MPIYAFACEFCGHHFDKLQKLSDVDPSVCPQCGKDGGIHRQLTAPQFRLAGGGWYETDFKKDGEKKSNLAGDAAKPAEAKAEPAANASAKSESPKPEAAKSATKSAD
ncbi:MULTISPECIES: zinc ribbon domain-containing protein [Thermomonas]|jgi:putative FmdB family regulatory protein|uniref:Zinc ribbon domain-containing protein n=1 Tax=Thermomonas beijingensis TaxID=2872701 RepID=A0ABS7TBB2_9GAMM|nr:MULTISPECIES: zinc ribbon domain-containing protein [Thermomonas]MBS0458940.1 zinc ribbon domain-containing protein [Pseudomonadota bacterium]MDE2381610.1 zinc ribbon domain-containing protein [Xanthomonadaceae bacterium]MBZ4185100.1 zinc ribbon domain-containing protein [Thermomonas beijingensis]HOC12099.1 zinc ribbon domain-containing protein [Thermomonas sp.]HOV95397.1 zinc ribbon domain-containing protein [Thermomonas sp.]